MPDKSWQKKPLLLSNEWMYIIAVGILSFLVFLPAMNYAFLTEWDDGGFIVQNPYLTLSLTNLQYWLTNTTQTVFTPVTMYSLMLDRWLFELNPIGYHIHNMLLHGIAAMLLYGIARHLGISCKVAFLVTILWAIHPQRIESVVWITERKDVLAGVFGFGAVLLFMRAFDRRQMSIAATILLLCAMGAKPSTVTLPGIMVIYAFSKCPKLSAIKFLLPEIFVTVGFYIYFYLISQSCLSGETESFSRLLLVVTHNGMWYLVTAFIPFELNPIYPRIGFNLNTLSVLLIGCGIIVGIIATIRLVKASFYRTVLFAAAWLCLFLPVSSFVRFTNTDYCDRYNYLLAGVAWLGAGMLVDKVLEMTKNNLRKNLLFSSLAFFTAIIYLFLTWSYMPSWKNSTQLFTRALETTYPNTCAAVCLGLNGLNLNNPATLELAGRTLIDLAEKNSEIRLPENLKNADSAYFTGIYFIGMAYVLQEQYADALQVLRLTEAAAYKKELNLYEAKTHLPKLWGSLATCYLKTGQVNDALRCLQNQLNTLEPDTAEAWFCRGMIAFLKKDLQQARRDWLKAKSINDSDPKILHNLNRVETLLKTSQPVKAE
ncbi:MAG: hypothetical protein WC071_00275 [Victivallaceae bacterium]